ncbi:PAS domain-containing protein [Benzoatithermus flavus]|uniref:histidine kinase n=1 Tax=Benzoatithermus flavus TaxID=3108223 RepID=A0ABU8XYR4_9PROT
MEAKLQQIRPVDETSESAQMLETPLDAASAAEWAIDLAGTTFAPSPRLARLFGYPEDRILSRADLRARYHPDDVARVEQLTETVLASGDCRLEYSFRIVLPDGRIRWVYSRGRLFRDARGRPIRAAGIMMDTTESRAAAFERERLGHERDMDRALLEAVMQRMPLGVIVAEAPSGRLILGNEQVARIWRRPFVAAETIEAYDAGYRGFHPDGRPYAPHEWPLARAIAIGEVVDGEEIRFLRGDGTLGIMNVSAAPIRDDAGRIAAGVVVFQDVTERRATEEILRESETRLRLAVEATGLGTWDVDVRTGSRRWSPEFHAIVGLPPETPPDPELFSRLIHPEDRDWVNAAYRAAYEPSGNGRYTAEFRIRRADDGTERWLVATGRVLFDDAGQPVRGIGTIMDVTERKRAEARQQLLLRELSHRVKNTLAVVQSIAARSLGGQRTLTEAREAFMKRLQALASAHDLLTAGHWRGASLRAVLRSELEPYGKRVRATGPDLTLAPEAAQTFALVLHELATNAAKYGALNAPEGRLEVVWELLRPAGDGQEATLRLLWQERDGPPVREPLHHGFGHTLIEQGLRYELGGEVRTEFRPEGLVCELTVPAGRALAEP